MSFVEREINKINFELHNAQTKDIYDQLYIAQQALVWSLDPEMVKSPYNYIMQVPSLFVETPPLEITENAID